MRPSNALKNLLLLAGSLVFCLILVEIIFAVFGISTLQKAPNYRSSSDVYHHGFVPDSSGVFKSSEWNVKYSIDSFGFRDHDYTISKPTGTFRILMLGDSYTEGYGVELSESFSKQLESMLNGKSTGTKFEVINAGVGSYSPILEYLVLKYKGMQLSPDVVILNFDWSDPHDDQVYSELAVWNGSDVFAVRQPPPESKSLSAKVRYFMSQHSHVYQFFAKKFSAATSQIVPGDRNSDKLIFLRDNLTDSDYNELFNNSVPYLLKIKGLLGEHDIPFVINTYPYALQVSTQAWKSGRKTFFFSDDKVYPAKPFGVVEKFGRENNITVTSSYSYFKAAANQSQLFFDYDGHFTPAGHSLEAKALYDYLENSTALSGH